MQTCHFRLHPGHPQSAPAHLQGSEGYQVSYQLSVSYLEIYFKVITDLLVPDGKSTNLEIRESPELGCYVDGLKTFTVKTSE